MKKVIVLGGGISGLSAAWKIAQLTEHKISLYEKNSKLGGLSGFHNFNDIKLDYGPHKIYSVIPGIMDVFKDILADGLLEINKRHKIILRGKLLDYPVNLVQVLSIFTFREIIEVSFSILSVLVTTPFKEPPKSYRDYCRGIFGKKIYEIVFEPLAQKIWGDPGILSSEIARKRIPTKNIYDLILRMLKIKRESRLSNAKTILYPRRGFYDICETIAGQITKTGNNIFLEKKPAKFTIKDSRIERITFDDNKEVECDLVISSIPLAELTELLFPADKNISKPENFIKMRDCIIVYLLINKPKVIDEHWIFCADRKFLFSRISEQKLLSDSGFPKNNTVLCCDFTRDNSDSMPQETDEQIVEKCIAGLEELKIIKKNEIIANCVVKIPTFYPSYETGYENKRDNLFKKINSIKNIICTGRLGMSDYYNIDHCLDMGIFIAESLAANKEPAQINLDLIKKTQTYRIVD